MSKTEILIKLRDLHEELAAINQNAKAEQIDEATIDALGQLITDAGLIVDQHRDYPKSSGELQKPDEIVNPDELNPGDLLDRVQRLESEHPLVGRFLSQVTDLLSMMGI